jgi:anti-sigma-K factor RskA
MDYGKPTLADALASEYVAGTLRGPARRRFETLLPSHPALQAAVRAWQARLMPLTTVLAPAEPSAMVWRGIEDRLWPAPKTSFAERRASEPSAWRGLAFWRGLAGFATVAALSCGLLLANPQPTAPPVVVVLQATDAGAGLAGTLVASFSADGQALVARPLTPVSLQEDRALELWWAPAQGVPRSLGLIRPDGSTVLARGRLPGGLRGSGIDHMAVSVEPPGGSPTGKPTGPVIFYGDLRL